MIGTVSIRFYISLTTVWHSIPAGLDRQQVQMKFDANTDSQGQ